MNIRQLRIFFMVCTYKNMSEASRKLFISQPAISQAIIELESELGVNLFNRLNRRLSITHAGEILYAYSKRILSLIDEAEKEMIDISNSKKGKLRIGASTTIGIYLLPSLISGFQKNYPTVDLPFIIDNTGEIEEKILTDQIDIGLVEGPIKSKDITVIHYLEDELYVVCSKDHPWADKNSISGEDLEKENLIIREEGSGTRVVFEQAMIRKNLTYHIKYTLSNTEAIKKAVEANLGIAIVSKIALTSELKSGILIKVKVDGVSFKRPLNIIVHKDKYRSEVFHSFIKYLLK